MSNEKIINIFSDAIEPEAINQFYATMSLPCNIAGALMPDAHAGYTLPIGAVIKSNGKIFPSYVGYDIGCGMSAIATSVDIFSQEDLIKLKDEILRRVPLGVKMHQKRQNLAKFEPAMPFAKDVFKDLAAYQIGTLGGGNHFIEVGTDDSGRLNIVVHSGSRGVGKKIAQEYMKLAAMSDVDEARYASEFETKNPWRKHNVQAWECAKNEFIYRRTRARVEIEGHFGFELKSELAEQYLHDLNETLRYALANRERMLEHILEAFKVVFGKVETERFINRNHNHAELVDGCVIHRKGATHARLDMMGVIPGNMKDGSFIVRGLGNENSLNSSSHGAGRVLSRSAAKVNLSVAEFHEQMSGIVTNHTDETIDEAPKAYKDIFEVMDMQRDFVEVVDRVRPVLNIKG